jgi:hypothetical protein
MAWIHDLGPDPVPPPVLDRVNYLGAPSTGPDGAHVPPDHDGPQAYLAVQGAQVTEIPTHFHSVEQFQYFVTGSGTIGGHRVASGVVHYADRFTPYGPISAGRSGLTYATLRPWHDTGVFVMPAAQDRLVELLQTVKRPAADRRQHTLDLGQSLREAPSAGTRSWIDLCQEADGFRISAIELLGRSIAPAVTVGGGGAYLVVMDGTIDSEGEAYGPGAIRWCAVGESAPERSGRSGRSGRAGREGAQLALLQFPAPA